MINAMIGTVVIGFLAGVLALILNPKDIRFGIFFTILIGIVGSFLGRFIGQSLRIYTSDEPAAYIGAIVGAVLILAMLSLTNSKRITNHR